MGPQGPQTLNQTLNPNVASPCYGANVPSYGVDVITTMSIGAVGTPRAPNPKPNPINPNVASPCYGANAPSYGVDVITTMSIRGQWDPKGPKPSTPSLEEYLNPNSGKRLWFTNPFLSPLALFSYFLRGWSGPCCTFRLQCNERRCLFDVFCKTVRTVWKFNKTIKKHGFLGACLLNPKPFISESI